MKCIVLLLEYSFFDTKQALYYLIGIKVRLSCCEMLLLLYTKEPNSKINAQYLLVSIMLTYMIQPCSKLLAQTLLDKPLLASSPIVRILTKA